MGAEGGAIFNNSKKGLASIIAINCTFLNNKAVNAGGAVMDNGMSKMTNSIFENCRFIKNSSKYGGAYFSSNTDSKKEIFKDCKFINNESEYGAAGFISSELNFDGKVYNQACTFKGNKSKDKQTIYYQQRNNLNEAIKETLKANSGISL